MNEVIWKYKFNSPINGSSGCFAMPTGAKILDLQVQDGILCFWAQVYTGNKLVKREFYLYRTGHPIIPVAFKTYIGTFQLDGFVWHLFDAGEQGDL